MKKNGKNLVRPFNIVERRNFIFIYIYTFFFFITEIMTTTQLQSNLFFLYVFFLLYDVLAFGINMKNS